MSAPEFVAASFSAAVPSRELMASRKAAVMGSHMSIGSLYLITLFMTCQRTTELVAALLVLSVANVTYAGIMWGASRRTVDVTLAREKSVDFAFYAGATVFSTLFNMQLMHVASLPTYIAVQNAGPFVSHLASEAMRRTSLMRDAFKPEQKRAAVAYAAGMGAYLIPGAAAFVFGTRAWDAEFVPPPLHVQVWWVLLSVAAAAVRHVTACRLPSGAPHDTMHAAEHAGGALFSVVYIMTFKAFDDTISVDVNRAANYLTLCAVLSLGVDACSVAAHDYNRDHIAADAAGMPPHGAPIALQTLTLGARALVLAFCFVTMVPFDGYIAFLVVGHAAMMYAVYTFTVMLPREERVVIDMLDMGLAKGAPLPVSVGDRTAVDVSRNEDNVSVHTHNSITAS